MFRQKFLAYARFVVETVERRFRGNLHQIAIAFFILRQDQKMVVRVPIGRSTFDVVIVLLAYIELTTDDRLDPHMLGRIHEMHCAKNIAVIGHGNRGHAQLLRALAEFVYVAGAVKHGIVSMEMKMNELGHGLGVDPCNRFYVTLILIGDSQRETASYPQQSTPESKPAELS